MSDIAFAACRIAIASVLSSIKFNREDEEIWEKLAALSKDKQRPIALIASKADSPVSASIWAGIILGQLYRWESGGREGAEWLFPLMEASCLAEGQAETLVMRVCRVVSLFGEAEKKPEADGEALPSEILWDLVDALNEAAEACIHDHAPAAYDIAATAVDLFPILEISPPLRAEPARRTLSKIFRESARLGGRAEQMAAAMMFQAFDALSVADTHPDDRLEAFDRCEEAIERTRALPAGVLRSHLMSTLGLLLQRRPWARSLMLLLIPDLQAHSNFEEVLNLSNVQNWQPRISRTNSTEWIASVKQRLAQTFLEQEVERDRLAMEARPPLESPAANNLDWTIDHPAYRRAVPHNRSFLREQNFSENILTLMHELTHVFSYMSPVGYALIALQMVTTVSELILVNTFDAPQGAERSAGPGLARLAAGDASALVFAEYQLGLIAKLVVLVEIWRPWFEGLAVFAESGTDPTLDPDNINDVHLCLRGLVDHDFTPGKENPESFDTYVNKFEDRCSAAMKEKSLGRLRAIFSKGGPVYFAGYMAVRAIVSSWRHSMGRAESGAVLFALLLHATRFGTFDAIPDLSLPIESFGDEAERLMAGWVKSLAALSRDEIEAFIRSDGPDQPGRLYAWKDGHIGQVPDRELAALVTKADARVLAMLKRAFGSMTYGPSDLFVAAQDDDETAGVLNRIVDDLRRDLRHQYSGQDLSSTWHEIFQRRLEANCLLPIGRSASHFALNIDADETSRFMVTMRTTEKHVDTGEPSINGVILPVDMESAIALKRNYDLEANPRINVCRMIDLGSVLFSSVKIKFLHFLVFEYGEWCDVRPAIHALDERCRRDAEEVEEARARAKHRLHPAFTDGLDTAVAARGIEPTQRTQEWLTKSEAWSVDGQPFDEATAWAGALQSLCRDILSSRLAETYRSRAIRALSDAIFPGEPSIAKAAEVGLWLLTAKKMSDRDAIVEALIATSHRPSQSEWLDTNTDRISALGLDLFERTARGWDVRRASWGLDRTDGKETP